MAMAVFGLALYLIGLARWAKGLQEKNATRRRKRIYGVVAAMPMVLMPLFVGGAAEL